MEEQNYNSVFSINTALKRALLHHMDRPGTFPTAIEGLSLIRRDADDCSERCFEKPLVAIVVQGSKRSIFGTQEYRYSERQYLVAGIDMPASFSAVSATPETPFLSLALYLDRALITELSVEIAQAGQPDREKSPSIAVADVEPDFLNAALRLVELLDKKSQIPIRAPLILRELYYLLLVGPHGSILRQLNTPGTQNNQVMQAIAWMRQNFEKPLSIERLAQKVHMSTSSLHRHFKTLTGLSPLQYHKQLRLYEARRLMLTENERASSAAMAVGYVSITQFNREYKRLFGNPPHRDTAQYRGIIL